MKIINHKSDLVNFSTLDLQKRCAEVWKNLVKRDKEKMNKLPGQYLNILKIRPVKRKEYKDDLFDLS